MSAAKFQSPSYRLFEVSRIPDFVPTSLLSQQLYEKKNQDRLSFDLIPLCPVPACVLHSKLSRSFSTRDREALSTNTTRFKAGLSSK